MTLRAIVFTGRRRPNQFGPSWLVPVAIISFWVVVTALTLWELGTLGPALSRLAAATAQPDSHQREVVGWAPKPLLFSEASGSR